MTTLTDTHLVLLSQAAQRPDHAVVLPERLKGQAAANTAGRLLRLGLIEEVAAGGTFPIWRRDDEGAYALRITAAGLAAIGVEEGAPTGAQKGEGASCDPRPGARPGSKQALLLALLARTEGATLADLASATGWLPHTTRAALTGLRRTGVSLASAKDSVGPRVYRITDGQGA